jgi:hypothetical protein
MPLILFPDTPVAVREPSPKPQQERFLTPPPRQCSLPVTPVALTEASKTAKIIADIKARAAALAMSSPEQSPILELKELEDSSDEEEQFFVPRSVVPHTLFRCRGSQGGQMQTDAGSFQRGVDL